MTLPAVGYSNSSFGSIFDGRSHEGAFVEHSAPALQPEHAMHFTAEAPHIHRDSTSPTEFEVMLP